MTRCHILLLSNTHKIKAVTDERDHIGAVIHGLRYCTLLLVLLKIELGALPHRTNLQALHSGRRPQILLPVRILHLLLLLPMIDDDEQVVQLIFILHLYQYLLSCSEREIK